MINFTVISDAILDLKTMNVAAEYVTHRHIANIIILVLLNIFMPSKW